MSVGWLDRPIKFDGTAKERSQNRASHAWVSDGPDEAPICLDCDVKYWYVSADYACGVDVPRERVYYEGEWT